MGALEKASISRLDKGSPSESFDVMFNPKELTFSKENKWKQNESPKKDAPDIDFTGGGAASLKVQLYFDTYTTDQKDVTTLTDKIHQLMIVDPKTINKKTHKGRPPEVRFHWGNLVFNGVISSFGEKLTLFLPDGTPVRAVVDLTFTQSKDALFYPKQNPTSGSAGSDRVWVVRAGDTLPWIAYHEYNDATAWRPIADANRLTRVRTLRPGTVLVIPNA